MPLATDTDTHTQHPDFMDRSNFKKPGMPYQPKASAPGLKIYLAQTVHINKFSLYQDVDIFTHGHTTTVFSLKKLSSNDSGDIHFVGSLVSLSDL